MKDLFIKDVMGGGLLPMPNVEESSFERISEINGEMSLAFVYHKLPNDAAYSILKELSILTYKGHTYEVVSVANSHRSKDVFAVSTFFELNKKRQYTMLTGVRTHTELLSFIFGGTGWTYMHYGAMFNGAIRGFGEKSVTRLIRMFCVAARKEISVDVVNKVVTFYDRIGIDTGQIYRYNENIITMKHVVDTTNLATVIRGYGKDLAQGSGTPNVVTTEYRSPNISLYGERHAEPITDERFTNTTTLLAYLKTQLVDTPQVAIETELLPTTLNLGDGLIIKHEPLGLTLQARVLRITERKPAHLTSYVIGTDNFDLSLLEDGITDEIANQTELIEEVDYNQKEVRGNLEAYIRVADGQIELAVERANESLAAISIVEGQISSKVEKNGVISAINQTAESITIDASKINLRGSVMIDGTVSGATTISVTTNIKIGHRIEFADFTSLSVTGGGSLTLMAFNNIYYDAAHHSFNGTVDFSNATVIGL